MDKGRAIRGDQMKKCPVCGREFWCHDPELWAYRAKRSPKSKGKQICSWSCQVEYNRRGHGTKRKPREGYHYIKNIREDLRRAGITQTRAGEVIGRKVCDMVAILDGERSCGYDKIVKLAALIGADPADLILTEAQTQKETAL